MSPKRHPVFFPTSASAAAEDDQQGNDDQPKPVIVEQVTKTVIHKKVLPYDIEGCCPSIL